MVFIETFTNTLIDIGFVQVLTLLMMIVISYAVLSKSKVFGKADDLTKHEERRANAIYMVLSLILGFMVFVSPIGRTIDLWFTKYFVHILIILATMLGGTLILGATGHEFNFASRPEWVRLMLIFGTLAIALLIFFNAGGLELFGIQGNEFGIPGSSPFQAIWQYWMWDEILGIILMLSIFGGALFLIWNAAKPPRTP